MSSFSTLPSFSINKRQNNELVVEVNFFYQPLEGEVVAHQHLVLVPPFDHGNMSIFIFYSPVFITMCSVQRLRDPEVPC